MKHRVCRDRIQKIALVRVHFFLIADYGKDKRQKDSRTAECDKCSNKHPEQHFPVAAVVKAAEFYVRKPHNDRNKN